MIDVDCHTSKLAAIAFSHNADVIATASVKVSSLNEELERVVMGMGSCLLI